MLDVALLPREYAICRLPAGSHVPNDLLSGATAEDVVSVTWAGDEISIICLTGRVPRGATVETPWRCMRVSGPMHLAATGVLASLTGPLADARVNLVAFSTYDTDYLLVPSVRLVEALAALTEAGHRVST